MLSSDRSTNSSVCERAFVPWQTELRSRYNDTECVPYHEIMIENALSYFADLVTFVQNSHTVNISCSHSYSEPYRIVSNIHFNASCFVLVLSMTNTHVVFEINDQAINEQTICNVNIFRLIFNCVDSRNESERSVSEESRDLSSSEFQPL